MCALPQGMNKNAESKRQREPSRIQHAAEQLAANELVQMAKLCIDSLHSSIGADHGSDDETFAHATPLLVTPPNHQSSYKSRCYTPQGYVIPPLTCHPLSQMPFPHGCHPPPPCTVTVAAKYLGLLGQISRLVV